VAARPVWVGRSWHACGRSGRGEIKALQFAPGEHDWQLLAGDDTAVPAIAAITEALPPAAVARVFVQVPAPADMRDLTSAADIEVAWTVGGGLAEAVRNAALPTGTPYAWVAGESSLVRDLRRLVTGERAFDHKGHYFGGYWKYGQSE
jgi:NADPH-dependent ferric siderophore reductase